MFRPTHRALGAVATAATALAAGALAAPAAHAATGHACTVNGGAAGCAATDTVPAGTALNLNDVGIAISDDFFLAGGPNNARCTRAFGAAQLVSDGGPAFPVGGSGASLTLAGLTLDNGTPFNRCTSVLAGMPFHSVVSVQDSNGSTAGLTSLTADWNAGAARVVAHDFTLRWELFYPSQPSTSMPVWRCDYRSTAFTGTASNNAAGRVTFSSQPVSKIAVAGNYGACPTSASISFPVNLVRAGAAPVGGPFYVSA